MIRVLLADNHAELRRGIRRMLDEYPGIRVTAEVSTGEGLLGCIGAESFEVALIDISMPEMIHLNLLHRLREINPELPVIVIGLYSDAPLASRILNNGAAGYLTKECPAEEIVAAIRLVASGGGYVSRCVGTGGGQDGSWNDSIPGLGFSALELEIILHLAAGLSKGEIARELSVSRSTVNRHMRTMLERSGLAGETNLVNLARVTGLIRE